MNLLTVLMTIGSPLIMAFIASVIVGIAFKGSSAILMIKRCVTFIVFLLYFGLCVYGFYVLGGVWKYVIMFAPVALILITVIVSVIVAPKGKVVNDDEPIKMTGFSSMFPNDIDNYKG